MSQVFIDVRTESEWKTGHVENAMHLPLEDLMNGQDPELPKDTTIYVYCRTGNRSALAQQLLSSKGYADVHNAGGLDEAKALSKSS